MSDQATAGVQTSVTVPLDPERAFELFVDRFEDWWPNDGTHALTDATGYLMEARPDGRWGEHGPDGFQPRGRVLDVDRPRQILLAWQLTPDFAYDPDPARQTEVEVTFEQTSEGTKVTLEHRGFEVWGEPGAEMRGSVEGGWATLLERYAGRAAA